MVIATARRHLSGSKSNPHAHSSAACPATRGLR